MISGAEALAYASKDAQEFEVLWDKNSRNSGNFNGNHSLDDPPFSSVSSIMRSTDLPRQHTQSLTRLYRDTRRPRMDPEYEATLRGPGSYQWEVAHGNNKFHRTVSMPFSVKRRTTDMEYTIEGRSGVPFVGKAFVRERQGLYSPGPGYLLNSSLDATGAKFTSSDRRCTFVDMHNKDLNSLTILHLFEYVLATVTSLTSLKNLMWGRGQSTAHKLTSLERTPLD